MSNSQARDELLQELEEEGDEFFDAGRFNNIADIALSIVAVLSSLAATVLVGTTAERWITATVAAVPAACASLQKLIDVKGRSNWYFQYAARVRALAIALKYCDAPNVLEFAHKRADLEVEMEKEWSPIGRSGITPSSRSKSKEK